MYYSMKVRIITPENKDILDALEEIIPYIKRISDFSIESPNMNDKKHTAEREDFDLHYLSLPSQMSVYKQPLYGNNTIIVDEVKDNEELLTVARELENLGYDVGFGFKLMSTYKYAISFVELMYYESYDACKKALNTFYNDIVPLAEEVKLGKIDQVELSNRLNKLYEIKNIKGEDKLVRIIDGHEHSFKEELEFKLGM